MSEDTAVAQPLLCRRCGASHGPEARFCQQCGAKLPFHPSLPPSTVPPHLSINAANPAHVREQVDRLTQAAQAAREAGQIPEAESICGEALKLDSTAIPPRLLRAELLEEQGKLEAAVLDVQDLVRLDPDRRSYRRWYTRLRRRMFTLSPSARIRPAWSGFVSALILCWLAIAALAAFGFYMILGPSARPAQSPPPTTTMLQSGAPSSGAAIGGAASIPPAATSLRSQDSFTPSAQASATFDASESNGAAPRTASPVPVRRTETPTAIIVPPARIATRYTSGAGTAPRVAAPSAPIFTSPSETAPPPTVPVPPAPVPPSFKTALSQAQAHFASGDYGSAILDYNHALSSAPTVLDSARVHQQMGITYSSMGAPREARSHYATAQQLYSSLLSGPDDAVAKEAIQNLQRQQQMLDNIP